ncbi:hypothetical protein K438DRAFT_1976436 [Mycena galopus ATCC 62051]|nr:hypothetical protein K438DRAFT_1976436 [Mycena galopus ATCC 62051]
MQRVLRCYCCLVPGSSRLRTLRVLDLSRRAPWRPHAHGESRLTLHGSSRPAASAELSRVAAPPSARGRVSLPVALLAHARTNSAQRQIAHAARGLSPHDAVVSAASPPQPALRTLPLHPHPPDLMPLASALLLPVLLSPTPFCLTLPPHASLPHPIPSLSSLTPHSSV